MKTGAVGRFPPGRYRPGDKNSRQKKLRKCHGGNGTGTRGLRMPPHPSVEFKQAASSC